MTLHIGVMAQKLILQHKKHEHKTKRLNLERDFDIKTTDTIFYFKKIVGFNDSTLFLLTERKIGQDTVNGITYMRTTYSKSNFLRLGEPKDTLITERRISPIYRTDTTAILFSEIKTIKKDWFEKRGWLEPFGWIAIGSILSVGLLPVAAIDDGKEGVREWAAFQGVLWAVSLPPIFIGTRKTKYNLSKKWKLKRIQ